MNKLLLTILAAIVLSPLTVAAQANPTYIPLEPLPCIPSINVDCSQNGPGNPTGPNGNGAVNFQTYIQYIINVVIAIAAAASIFMIVLGGLQYMTTDSWTGKSAGLSKLKNALLGLVLVLTSYLILRTIDPRLVMISTTLVDPLKIPQTNVDLTYMDSFLSSQSQKYMQQNVAAKADVEAKKVALASQQRQWSSIEKEVATYAATNNYYPEDIDAFCKTATKGQYPEELFDKCQELNKKGAEIIITRNSIDSVSVIGALDGLLAECSNQKPVKTTDCYNNITKIASDSSNISNPETKQIVSDYVVYAKAVVDVTFIGQKLDGRTDILPREYGGVIFDANATSGGIKDQSLKDKFIKERNRIITEVLKGKQTDIDNGSYLKAYNDYKLSTQFRR